MIRVDLGQKVLEANDLLARRNRTIFTELGILA